MVTAMARSDLYWRMRAERLKKQIHRGDRIPYSKILQLYRQAFLAIDEDIRAIENARGKTVFAESEQAKRELAKIAAAAPDVRRQNEAIKAFSAYQQRIDRAELVKARAYAHLMKMAGTVSRTLGAYLSDVYKAARYGTADDMAKGLNCGIDFALIPERTIEKVIAAPFYGKNYSETVWDNTKEAAEKAQEVITEGLIRGSSYPKMAKALSKVANNTYYNAYRLIQTDTTHFIEQGRFDTYRDIGVKKYTYYATLGSKTCDVCAALDGRTFDVEDAREGKNKPPIHPHCACYTVVGDVALTARMARDPATGKNYKVRGDMTYREWKDSLTDEQRMAIKAYRNRHADAAQYLRYTERLGKENLPKTLDLYQKMKYNDSEKWRYVKLDYQRQSALVKNPELALPNAAYATADNRKFTEYLFGGTHENGLAKGAAFTSRLGYDIDNYGKLKDEILKKAGKYPSVLKDTGVYGEKYEQKMILYGVKGKPANVIIGWQTNDDKTWMTSGYIKELR